MPENKYPENMANDCMYPRDSVEFLKVDSGRKVAITMWTAEGAAGVLLTREDFDRLVGGVS